MKARMVARNGDARFVLYKDMNPQEAEFFSHVRAMQFENSIYSFYIELMVEQQDDILLANVTHCTLRDEHGELSMTEHEGGFLLLMAGHGWTV